MGRIGAEFDYSGQIGTNQNHPRTTLVITHELKRFYCLGKSQIVFVSLGVVSVVEVVASPYCYEDDQNNRTTPGLDLGVVN